MAAGRLAAGSPLVGHRPLEAPEPSQNVCSSVTFLPERQRWGCSLFMWVACCATPRAPGCPPPRPPRRAGAVAAPGRVLPDGRRGGGLPWSILSAVCALQGPPCLCRRSRRQPRRSCRRTRRRSPSSRGAQRTWSGVPTGATRADGWRWAPRRGQLSSPGAARALVPAPSPEGGGRGGAVLPGERRPWSEGHLSRPRSWTQDSCPSRGLRAEAALPGGASAGRPARDAPAAAASRCSTDTAVRRGPRGQTSRGPGARSPASCPRWLRGLRRRQTSGAVSCGLGQAAAQDRRVGAQGA